MAGAENSETQTQHFSHAGMDCKVVKTDLGHYCGYVKRPESVEPTRWTSDYDTKQNQLLDPEVDVWGGITYGPDEDGWVGFDDSHARKIANLRDFDTAEEAVTAETKELAEQIAEMRDENTTETHEITLERSESVVVITDHETEITTQGDSKTEALLMLVDALVLFDETDADPLELAVDVFDESTTDDHTKEGWSP